MARLGLISAVRFEAGEILKAIRSGRDLRYISSGIGQANVARAVTSLACLGKRERPSALILFGIGGAMPGSGLGPGDVVLAEKEIYADTGLARPSGKRRHFSIGGMQEMGFPLLKVGRREFYNEFPLDKDLLKTAKKSLSVSSGTFITVCASSRYAARARALRRKYGALVENMEGAAAAQTALFFGLPLVEIRGISNIAGEPPHKWKKELAARNCGQAVLKLIEHL